MNTPLQDLLEWAEGQDIIDCYDEGIFKGMLIEKINSMMLSERNIMDDMFIQGYADRGENEKGFDYRFEKKFPTHPINVL
jgi:hypothetical protein